MPAGMKKRIRERIAGMNRQSGENEPSGSVTSDVASASGSQMPVPIKAEKDGEDVPPPLIRILNSVRQKMKMEEIPEVEREEEWHNQMDKIRSELHRDTNEHGWEQGGEQVEAFFDYLVASQTSVPAERED